MKTTLKYSLIALLLICFNIVKSQDINEINKIRSNTEKYIKKNDIKLRTKPLKVLPAFIESISLNENAELRLNIFIELYDKFHTIKGDMFIDKELRCYVYEGLVDINTFVLNNDRFLHIGKANGFVGDKFYTIIVFSKTNFVDNETFPFERKLLEDEIKLAFKNDTIIKNIFIEINKERKRRGLGEYEFSYELCFEAYKYFMKGLELNNNIYISKNNYTSKKLVQHLFETNPESNPLLIQCNTGKKRTITTYNLNGDISQKLDYAALVAFYGKNPTKEQMYDITTPKIGIAYKLCYNKQLGYFYNIQYIFDELTVY